MPLGIRSVRIRSRARAVVVTIPPPSSPKGYGRTHTSPSTGRTVPVGTLIGVARQRKGVSVYPGHQGWCRLWCYILHDRRTSPIPPTLLGPLTHQTTFPQDPCSLSSRFRVSTGGTYDPSHDTENPKVPDGARVIRTHHPVKWSLPPTWSTYPPSTTTPRNSRVPVPHRDPSLDLHRNSSVLPPLSRGPSTTQTPFCDPVYQGRRTQGCPGHDHCRTDTASETGSGSNRASGPSPYTDSTTSDTTKCHRGGPHRSGRPTIQGVRRHV